MSIVFYSRWDCPLCDDAWEWLQQCCTAKVDWRDVSADPALEQRYGWSVPVLVLNDGQEFCLADPEQRRAAQLALASIVGAPG